MLRLWARPGGVTVTVTDAGPGPTDPLVDLPSSGAPMGSGDGLPSGPALGVWLMHQLVDVTRRSDHNGYTICLTVPPRDGNTS